MELDTLIVYRCKRYIPEFINIKGKTFVFWRVAL